MIAWVRGPGCCVMTPEWFCGRGRESGLFHDDDVLCGLETWGLRRCGWWCWQDFERERKWKLSQAKKVALRVNRSKLDVVARENRRLKVRWPSR